MERERERKGKEQDLRVAKKIARTLQIIFIIH